MRTTDTSHFWVGRFPDEPRVADYFAEVYDENDEDRDHTPLSAFARDQGVSWYDHDFLEHGFRPGAGSIAELVDGHSYHAQWAAEVSRRAAGAGLTGMNLIVFIRADEIEAPRSVRGEGYELHYLGTMTYGI